MTAPEAVHQLVEKFDKGSAAITTKRSCGILGLDRPNGRFYYGCMDNVKKMRVSLTAHMLFAERPDLEMWWYAWLGLSPKQSKIYLMSMGLSYEGEEEELVAPVRPVWINGLEDLWEDNLRPEFCVLERELFQDFAAWDAGDGGRSAGQLRAACAVPSSRQQTGNSAIFKDRDAYLVAGFSHFWQSHNCVYGELWQGLARGIGSPIH